MTVLLNEEKTVVNYTWSYVLEWMYMYMYIVQLTKVVLECPSIVGGQLKKLVFMTSCTKLALVQF